MTTRDEALRAIRDGALADGDEKLAASVDALVAGNAAQLTRDDLKGMAPEAIEQARLDGRLDTLMRGDHR